METPNLELPYLMAAQAQKHVTLNEGLRRLDALVHLSVLSRSVTVPPESPTDGDRYILPVGADSDWGRADQLAAYQDGAWEIIPAKPGFIAFVVDEVALIVFDGSNWRELIESELQSLIKLGINSQASGDDHLSVAGPASLFDGSSTGGSHRLKINKGAVTDTASLLFQSAFSGRAEFGLTGSDVFSIRTSSNGTSWQTVVECPPDGPAAFPNGIEAPSINGQAFGGLRNVLINGDFSIAQRESSVNHVRSIDMWYLNKSGSSSFTYKRLQLADTDLPAGSGTVYCLHAETLVAENNFGLLYGVEDVRVLADSDMVLSFFLRTNASQPLNLKVIQKFGSGGSPNHVQVLSITGTTSWARVSIPISLPSLAGKTIGNSNRTILELSNGANEAWFMDLVDIQLERGTIATPFERRPHALELSLCRHYFRKYATAKSTSDLAHEMHKTPQQSLHSGIYWYEADVL